MSRKKNEDVTVKPTNPELEVPVDAGPVFDEVAVQPEPMPHGISLWSPSLSPLSVVTGHPAVIFIRTYWKLILFLLMSAALVYQHLRMQTLEQEVLTAQQEVKTAEERLVTCDDKVTQLSNRITELSVTSAVLQKQLDGLGPTIDRIRRNTDRTVAEILNNPAPVSCQEINDYILNNQRRYNWRDVE